MHAVKKPPGRILARHHLRGNGRMPNIIVTRPYNDGRTVAGPVDRRKEGG
jgi:hypothetical protein